MQLLYLDPLRFQFFLQSPVIGIQPYTAGIGRIGLAPQGRHIFGILPAQSRFLFIPLGKRPPLGFEARFLGSQQAHLGLQPLCHTLLLLQFGLQLSAAVPFGLAEQGEEVGEDPVPVDVCGDAHFVSSGGGDAVASGVVEQRSREPF